MSATPLLGSRRQRRSRAQSRRISPPLEHRLLLTATFCLLAFGAVMVYSASSGIGVLAAGGGYGTGEFVVYLVACVLGLAAMKLLELKGLDLITPRLVKLALGGSFVLLLLVMLPGFGIEAGGSRRWFGMGPIQFQPSELMKFSLILYVARDLADNERRLHKGFKRALAPLATVIGPACLLIVAEPDLGTTLVIALTMIGLLIAAGVPMKWIGGVILIGCVGVLLMLTVQPYQAARLTSFLHPGSAGTAQGTYYQAHQGQIAIGSGGMFGVGLGQGVQKLQYLPEAQTDFILAVVGEELGVMGIGIVVVLYGMIAWAGLQAARRGRSRYAKLLATGLTSLILCQGILNMFVVLGIAPLTGVPLPFISYAPTNLCVMLASVGLLLNVSRRGARKLQGIDGDAADMIKLVARDTRGDRGGGNGRTRGAGAGSRRRAAS